jgi:O6-methylguanine-DNA--protein-cysteine methyltransferase
LDAYFKGERQTFDVPLDLAGTEFQKQIWLSLLRIPYGCTTSYGRQAEQIGKPPLLQ